MEYVFYGLMASSVIAFILVIVAFFASEADGLTIDVTLIQVLLSTILFCVASIAAKFYGTG